MEIVHKTKISELEIGVTFLGETKRAHLFLSARVFYFVVFSFFFFSSVSVVVVVDLHVAVS